MARRVHRKSGAAPGQDSSRARGVSAVMALTLESRITLNDGAKIRVLGLGVWQAGAGTGARKGGSAAPASGHRLIGTAELAGNERCGGAGVGESGCRRCEGVGSP